MAKDWKLDPATKRQKEKLRFFKIKFTKDLTKGEASKLLDQINDPDREEKYQEWRDRKDEQEEAREFEQMRIEDFQEDWDWLELEKLRKPTKKVAKEILGKLDSNYPGWEDKNRALFFDTLRKEYPEFRKGAKRKSSGRNRSGKRKSDPFGVAVMLVILAVMFFVFFVSMVYG